MYSSSSVSKRFVSVSILAVVAIPLVFMRSVLSLSQTIALNQTNEYLHHKCINSQGTYNSGSPYEESLNRVVRSISNGIFAVLGRRCPKNKGGIIWYDNCVLEISSVNTLAKIDYQNYFYLFNAKDMSDNIDSFNKNTKALLYKLKEKANSKENNAGKDNTVYAAGENVFGTKKLYAMVQCRKDLSPDECNVCLNWILPMLPKCCNGKQGGRVLSTSCNFRYELYPFVKT
ncbi:hypothetical protein EUTSA_v10022109mg [Eutrema salsugineum]|uniref:Gnk2-homologous domain-containing protein n=1 Tax=Eutrema salsugineum TaxID=72664 RepID=V4M5V6_EUTSA|nr:hypothetical protein EUTSA_v10022109mg [Eutrema salsugineum]